MIGDVIVHEVRNLCQYFGADAILHNIVVNLRDPHFEEDGNEIYEGHENAKYAGPQSHRGVVVRDYIENALHIFEHFLNNYC